MSQSKSRQKPDVYALLADIRSTDAKTRLKAQQRCGSVGAEAISPLAEIAASADKGAAKAAHGAIETIVHYSARPGAGTEARVVSAELLKVAKSDLPFRVRADALYLLGFTASDGKTMNAIAELLDDPELRDEARMALERIPGNTATNILSKATREAPADFRPHLEQTLRNRATGMKAVGVASNNKL